MKKLLIALPVFVLALAFAVVPALACENNHRGHRHAPTSHVSNTNNAYVYNNLNTWSNTGRNLTGCCWFKTGTINTGSAKSNSYVENNVGQNVTTVTPRMMSSWHVRNVNNSTVNNMVKTGANSGWNHASGGSISTGAAGSSASLVNFIGSNMTTL